MSSGTPYRVPRTLWWIPVLEVLAAGRAVSVMSERVSPTGILSDPLRTVKIQSWRPEERSGSWAEQGRYGQVCSGGHVDAYASSLRASGKAEKTIAVYLQTIRAYAQHLDPNTASCRDIESWLAGLGVGANTLGQYLVRLRQFHKWMIREGYRTDNPVDGIEPPKVAPKKPRPLPEQYLHAIWQLACPVERAWIVLGLYCGLRAGEAVKVAVEDIVDGPSLRVTGKGDRTRVVPLRPEVLEALQAVWPRSGRFFPDAGEKSASTRIGRLLRQVGCPDLYSFHSLRHSFGSSAYKASRDIRLVQELLGHASLNTTQGYVSFDDEQARWVVGRLPTMVA